LADKLSTKFSGIYTKTEADSAIAAAVAAADHLKRKIVDAVDDIDLTAADADQYIYMVPNGADEAGDKYDEYMVISGALEKVGDWEVDLSEYAKTADVNTELAKKVDKVDGSRLMTTAEGEKLASDTKVEASETNGNVKIDGNETTVYTHPAYEAAAAAFIKVGRDASGHVVTGDAIAKADLDSLIGNASSTEAGEMSAADKTKLDGIEVATDDEVAALLTEKLGA